MSDPREWLFDRQSHLGGEPRDKALDEIILERRVERLEEARRRERGKTRITLAGVGLSILLGLFSLWDRFAGMLP